MTDGCPPDLSAVVGGPVEAVRREDRWLAITDDLVVFAADHDAAWQRLTREAWLLERWRAAGIPAPTVRASDPEARVQVREKLHGLTGDEVHGQLPDVISLLAGTPLSRFGETLAASYGELAARIRRAVTPAEARAAGLGETSRRALDLDHALACLDASHASPRAKAAAHRARDWLAAIAPPDAVIHADLHFHNMCTAPDGTITGIFDVGDAGLDDPAVELMYIDSIGPQFAALALAAYGPIDRDAVRRAHARTALDHVAYHGPGTPRHDGIIAWATMVFEALD